MQIQRVLYRQSVGNDNSIKCNKASSKSSTAYHHSKLSFTGGKNYRQIASFTPENNGLGLAETSQGGEGCVAYEAIASLRHRENVDVRNFMPIWQYNNPKGGFKFLIHKAQNFPNGVASLPDTMPASAFYSADYGETIEQVAKKLNIKTSELSYVVQSKPNGLGPNARSKYCIIEPTSVKGSIQRLSDEVLGELKEIPYALFKVSKNNPSYNKIKGEPHYFVYTQALAKTAKPYSYDSHGNGSFGAEIINSDWMRIQADFLHSKMDTEEFGHFNPANVWCHDRVAHSYATHISNMSANGIKDVNGLKIHITAHNTGRNYQGLTSNPFEMLTIVAPPSDAQILRDLPEFEILKKAQRYGIDNVDVLTPREHISSWQVLEPYLRPFRDSAGTYNVLKTGLAAAEANPNNITTGTVSYTFDKEMRSVDTPDAAKFLTEDYARLNTKSVLNGVTPSNLRLDEQDVDFGRGGNGLSANKKGYTPFKYDGTNIKEVLEAKNKNAKWLTDLIWQAGEKGQGELNKLFFNEAQITEGQNVLGYLSPIKDGEILIFGFGRPDEQKGFPISTGGFLEFFKNPNIPKETKLKVKGLFGAGLWDKNASDYKAIVRDLEEIWQLDGGAYKHNIMYVDGFTPSRFVACSHYGLFTSRREMCGITPIEAKAAGTPYGATKTGGPCDYTNATNGFLTEEAVELRPEKFGLKPDCADDVLNEARVKRQTPQVGEIINKMITQYSQHPEEYEAMAKKCIEEKLDWHNNGEFNGGKSTNRIYIEEVFAHGENDSNILKRITGTFGKCIDEGEKIINSNISRAKLGKVTLFIIGGVAILSGGYLTYINKYKKKKAFNKVA